MYHFYSISNISRWVLLTTLTLVMPVLKGQDVISVEDKLCSQEIGDCTLKRIHVDHDGRKGRKIYEVDVPTEGVYYLSAIVSSQIEEGKVKSFKIIVDDKLIDKIELANKEASFQNVSLINSTNQQLETLVLTKGIHKICFEVQGAYAPLIDAIRLARNPVEAQLTNINTSYINKLKQNKLPADYAETKSRGKGGRMLANPEGNYYHDIDIPFDYSYFSYVYLNQGETVTFETRNSNTDPVLYVFGAGTNNTETYSNDDGNGFESVINFTAGSANVYVLLVRKFNYASAGVSDIYKNGNLLTASVPVAGKWVQVNAKNASTNVFTSNLTSSADTRLFIATGGSTGPINYWNDDYNQSGGGDYNWGNASRIKQNFNGATVNAIISAYSTGSTGNCDFYANCEFSNATSYFPNLKSDDAIQTAPQSSVYNCGSWAGGITSFWWFPGAFSNWEVPGNPLQSFDNFYGNNPARYSGAYTYTRSGADASNAMVALWYNSSAGYTHVSVRKPGNDHPHGYDWESKPGQVMRTMHPRDALQDNGSGGYGAISNYYRYTGSNGRLAASGQPITLEESIKEGLSKLDTEDFTDFDYQVINKLREKLPASDLNQFNESFNAWNQTWRQPSLQIASNPRAYTTSKEYKALLSFLENKSVDLLPLIIDRFKKDDFPLTALIEDAVLPGNESLLASVKSENAQKFYDENRVYIVRSNTVNCIKFLKKLLAKQDQVLKTDAVVVEQNYPNTFMDGTTFRFFLPEKSNVTIELYSARNGKMISRIVNEISFEQGWQDYYWKNQLSIEPGTYFYRVFVNGKSTSSKRMIIK